MTDTQPPTQPAMAEQSEDPSTRELLERIVRLEAENAQIKACLLDLRKSQDVLMATLVDNLAQVNDALWPVVEKAFPQYREMKDRLDAIIPPCFVDPRIDRRRDGETG